MNLEFISRLYEKVLFHDITQNRLSNSEIRAAVRSLCYVYAPETSNLESNTLKFSDYNDPACRCAYLHKYAPLHTYIVLDAMLRILRIEPAVFRELLVENNVFNICSLGGGPGCDVIGVLAALRAVFGSFLSSVTIIDCMVKWEITLANLLRELTLESEGGQWNDCEWNYIESNLLCSMNNDVNKSIATASLITMVKFISATTCKDTELMVHKIFRVMKPGALLLYIDNAAGGFTQLIERSSKRNGFYSVVGPLRHVPYETEDLKIDRFGYTSCYKTKVTIMLLQKRSRVSQQNSNLPKAKPLSSLDFVVLGNNTSQEQNNSESTNINLLSETDVNSSISWNYVNDYPEKISNLERSLTNSNSNIGERNRADTRNVKNPKPRAHSSRRTQPTTYVQNNYVQNNYIEPREPQDTNEDCNDTCGCCVIS